MNYIEFADTVNKRPVFTINEVFKLYPDFDRKNLVRWQKKGYIKKLRNTFYYFSNRVINNEESLFYIANVIYSPSYISFESALSYYNIIPEAVFSVTSATSIKTNKFDTETGRFRYFHLKPGLFFGYQLIHSENLVIKMAEPEKMILDYLYINSGIQKDSDFESLRWNTDELKRQINKERLMQYATYINNNKLSERLETLLKFVYA